MINNSHVNVEVEALSMQVQSLNAFYKTKRKTFIITTNISGGSVVTSATNVQARAARSGRC